MDLFCMKSAIQYQDGVLYAILGFLRIDAVNPIELPTNVGIA